ncbi:glycosyltransferase [Selenomonas artemidis]|uniref:glycosyltransferase n=1 Tax=Selenomonas artemidis TaxID=671224 RepID=UPI0035CFBD5B
MHIGRGCLIRANSSVRADIPDYCVAEGNPARIVEAFSTKTGTWQSVADEEELRALLRERKETRPILTYAIITYNRSKYLRKSLKSVLDQVGSDELVEVLVSDNCSTDDTKEVVREFQKKYKNLRYHCNETNVGAEGNIHAALRHSKGEYVVVAGDDDYQADGSLYILLTHIYAHRDCALFYMANKEGEFGTYEGQGYLDVLEKMSFYITWITGVVIKKDVYMSISNPEKFNDSRIPQVYIQMEMLKRNPKFSIVYGSLFVLNQEGHLPRGYNLAEVFIKNYFNVLAATVEIPPARLSREKQRVMEEMIYPWCWRIKNQGVELSLDGIFDIVAEYYGKEPYYDEVVEKLKEIVGTSES